MKEFIEFPKIPRFSREMIITEKIDGTNAQVHITEDGDILFGSRSRWITPGDDNFGFARWAEGNKEGLLKLGPGSHFGEWWGQGIQRGYGLKEKRFSLFNISRWGDDEIRPACCYVVPKLYEGKFDTAFVESTLTMLGVTGSLAAPGFMQPEGIIVFHTASRYLFKKTIKGDDNPKSIFKG